MLQDSNQQRIRVFEPPSLPVACAGLTAFRSARDQAMLDLHEPFATVARQRRVKAP
jgi:hypothetical protein